MNHNGKPKHGLYDNIDIITANRVEEILANLTSERMQNLRNPGGMMDPRRNLNFDCGYPETGSITADGLKELYTRCPEAARVVELMPKECWQASPTVYETDDAERETEFEKAWDALEVAMSGGVSWHQTEQGSSIWEYLFRADVLSGIGSFGVLLMGFDDGRNLQDPVEGAVVDMDNPQPYANNSRWKPAMPDGWMLPWEKESLQKPKPRKVWNGLRDPKTGKATYTERADPVPDDEQQAIIANWQTYSDAIAANAQANGVSKNTLIFNAYNKAQNPGITPQYDLQLGQPAPFAEGAMAGTDQQYFAPIQGPSQQPNPTPSKKPLKLLFLRAFDESLVQIVRYEWNIRNPRFGLPVMYRITLNDPREQHTGVGLPLATVYVHWSRVIHLCDVNHQQTASEIFAAPRMRPVLNPLLDIMKISGASAEGYYQSCNEKLSFETHPQLGGDVDIDDDRMKDIFENIMNSHQRAWTARGMTVNAIAPTVVDPTPHYDLNVKRICIKIGCPVPVFQGYEIGEQASENNDDTWDGRVQHRQLNYLIPREIVPFVDRLITVGVLPEPTGYTVDWAEKDKESAKEKSDIGLVRTNTLAAYVSGQCETVIPPKEFLVDFLGVDDDNAQAYLDAAAKAVEGDMMTMPAPGELGHPATPQEPPEPPPALPIKVKGADGAEKLVHPDTVKQPAAKPPTGNAEPPDDDEDLDDDDPDSTPLEPARPTENVLIAPHLSAYGIANALTDNLDTPSFWQAVANDKTQAMTALQTCQRFLTTVDAPAVIVANVGNAINKLYAYHPDTATDDQLMTFVYGETEQVTNAQDLSDDDIRRLADEFARGKHAAN